MSNENNSVVTNKREMPLRKRRSAMGSNLLSVLMLPRIDKKERMQLPINNIIAAVVNSSIKDFFEIFKIFKEVNTTKQIPNKFEDAFKICGDFCSLLFSINIYCSV
jgi:hypothetical protein